VAPVGLLLESLETVAKRFQPLKLAVLLAAVVMLMPVLVGMGMIALKVLGFM
jgi:hypothetical protein